ncbi:RNA polymerase sigma-70 factor [Rufibacter immobilis]|uniref:RNA polymerase sigma-70 factor n=1 Tax=Rufibacter immobilis TaxID=1348778 RepID=A0A3M9MTR2_9BACT|nr:RNA polymerase sigma-70 factor [Rufibacter immobilis]RNI28901.1 RNA polymerase sigma-70 factor [Rufibacter immobilis]
MMLQGYTDEMLVVGIQNSDEDAFTELYQRYWQQLYASALRRMSSEDDAKDIIQELFVSIWTRRTKIPEDAKAAEYLFTALRYRIINYLQADQVRLRYANAQLAEQEVSTASLAESGLAVQELEIIIQEAVEDMPDRMQEIFLLSYRKGFTPKEIAAQLSLSVQTVKNSLSNARILLRGKVAHQNPEQYAHLLLLLSGVVIS